MKQRLMLHYFYYASYFAVALVAILYFAFAYYVWLALWLSPGGYGSVTALMLGIGPLSIPILLLFYSRKRLASLWLFIWAVVSFAIGIVQITQGDPLRLLLNMVLYFSLPMILLGMFLWLLAKWETILNSNDTVGEGAKGC